ncbi:ABC transporter permease [Demequina muriae]|uniref:Molybdenum transport system permease n=1 Tax=Demequina muriae TaxID=3051664 RepID=A0ABT8GIZ3_9MICO|nr:ABC transporter permease [Demequina sp. EGI L300058]MDN4481408.1 ABC transporter permease [Demequina sp. EGI L300058]
MIPLAIVSSTMVALPLLATTLRLDWARLPALLTAPAALDALSLSLRTAAMSTVLCILLGVPLGYALATWRSRFRPAVRALVLAPLVLPPVVGGLALLYAFGRRGLIGGPLADAGLDLAFSTAAVVLAQTFVAMPFMVLTVESAVSARSGHHESLAATLGAGRSTTLWRVTLPALRPALVTGTVLTFARALGEFGATLTFAGSLPGVTRTLPLEIYLRRETDADAAIALAMLLVTVAVVVVAVAYRPGVRSDR